MPSDSNVALALPPGAQLDHYEIKRTIGQGAFGVTYQSYSHRFRSACVIKELLPVDFATRASSTFDIIPLMAENRGILEKCRADFMREASILHEVNHPNVVKILDFFGGNGTSYMVMPYADGCDYERYLKRLKESGHRPTEKELLDLLFPVLDGLVCVHSKGFLHRDIKPENILVTAQGQPLLIDFGAARQVIGSRSRPISMILTPKYAPFEQYSSTKKQGPYTDIYSLGAVLHRAITGEPPPEAPDRADGDDKYVPLVMRYSGQYSQTFLNAIDWALRPQAALRPQTIQDWISALPQKASSYSSPPVEARIPDLPETRFTAPPPPPPPSELLPPAPITQLPPLEPTRYPTQIPLQPQQPSSQSYSQAPHQSEIRQVKQPMDGNKKLILICIASFIGLTLLILTILLVARS